MKRLTRKTSIDEEPFEDSSLDLDSSTAPIQDDLGMDNSFDDGLGLGDFGGDMYSGEMPVMEKHNDLLKDLTNFHPFVTEKINDWLGLVWNEEKGTFIPDTDNPPIMNVRCAKWCSSYLKTYTRGNNIITNMSEDEYRYMVCDMIDVVWIDLGVSMEKFGIDNLADYHRVANEMQHSIELVLMGAGGGKYNDLLSTITHRTESMNYQGQPGMGQPMSFNGQQNQPKKLGILGKLKKTLVGG